MSDGSIKTDAIFAEIATCYWLVIQVLLNPTNKEIFSKFLVVDMASNVCFSHFVVTGSAKSQILKFMCKVSQRSVFTTGTGSTTAGLTVAASMVIF